MSSAYLEGDLAQLWPHYTIDPDERETPSEPDNKEMRRVEPETRADRRAHNALMRLQAREELARKRKEIQERRRGAEARIRAQAKEALLAKQRQRLPQDEQPVYPAR